MVRHGVASRAQQSQQSQKSQLLLLLLLLLLLIIIMIIMILITILPAWPGQRQPEFAPLHHVPMSSTILPMAAALAKMAFVCVCWIHML